MAGRQEVQPLRPSGRDHDPDRLPQRLAGVRVVRLPLPQPRSRCYPAIKGGTKEARMSRVTVLLVGIAALTVISTIAEAADGCGRGWYYNGRRCVPQHDMGYRTHHRRYVEDDDIDYRRHHRRPGVSVDVAPGIRLHLGHHPRHHYDED